MHVIAGTNVNELFPMGLSLLRTMPVSNSRIPKGKQITLEFPEPVCSEYWNPTERVLFDEVRDINPFFHLMEAIWILAGREDVKWLSFFNKNMENYSDNGRSFHAPYGYRLRRSHGFDQLNTIIRILREDPESRQAVTSIWDVDLDLGTKTKDMPCNDMQFFKIRPSKDGKKKELDITVCCRSNDMIWGCYGTNAVQFSMIQEYVASALEIDVGIYRQISDSFHLYPDNDVYKRLCADREPYDYFNDDRYSIDCCKEERAVPTKLVNTSVSKWEEDLSMFMFVTDEIIEREKITKAKLKLNLLDDFFEKTAFPLFMTWCLYKHEGKRSALNYLENETIYGDGTKNDWFICSHSWLSRRKEKKSGR